MYIYIFVRAAQVRSCKALLINMSQQKKYVEIIFTSHMKIGQLLYVHFCS